MDREDAWNILCEYTKTEPLRKHALAVEAASSGPGLRSSFSDLKIILA